MEWYSWLPAVGPYLTVVLLVVVGWLAGRILEKRHFADLAAREAVIDSIPVLTRRRAPQHWQAQQISFVMGTTVISIDYFKRFVAGLKSLVGGNLRSVEPLLERGRREAILRMREAARDAGCHAVIGLRLDTSRLATMQGGNGIAGVELMAYGVGIRIDGQASELTHTLIPPPATPAVTHAPAPAAVPT